MGALLHVPKPPIPLKGKVQAKHRELLISTESLLLFCCCLFFFPFPACQITSFPCTRFCLSRSSGVVMMGRMDLNKHFLLLGFIRALP